MEEHVEHLWKVFQRLRKNMLYAKLKKCEFGVAEVDFLGHRITQEGLKMDDLVVFETLKGILVKAPMLKLPDFDKDFEIHSDASNFVIRGVLV
jgi:hypothetical protein